MNCWDTGFGSGPMDSGVIMISQPCAPFNSAEPCVTDTLLLIKAVDLGYAGPILLLNPSTCTVRVHSNTIGVSRLWYGNHREKGIVRVGALHTQVGKFYTLISHRSLILE